MQRNARLSILPSVKRQQVRVTRAQPFLLGWWVIYLLVSPIYVFRSGYPQPADGMMAVLILLLFTGYFVRVVVHPALYMVAFLFLGLVAITNWIWWVHYPDPKFFLSSLYYLYNFCNVMVVITLMKNSQQTFLTYTRVGLLATVLLELTVVMFLPEVRGVRHVGTFNNPNQLGYWCLVTAACLLNLKSDPGTARNESKLTFVDLSALLALGFIAAHSLSKAAMVSYLILMLAAMYCQGMGWRLKAVVVLLLAVGISIFVSTMDSSPSVRSDSLVERVFARFQDIGRQDDDAIEARGYDRIWLHPEYLLYGAGEGANERFDSLTDIEMHSTFGTILFSYGILGFVLFLGFLWIIFSRAHYRHLLYFVPICLYGLTHQGLRFSLLWIFLGLVFGRTYLQREATYGSNKPDAREQMRAA